MNPAPDVRAWNPSRPRNFEWIVNAVAKMAIHRALEPASAPAIVVSAFLKTAIPVRVAAASQETTNERRPSQLQHRHRGGIPKHRSRDSRSALSHPRHRNRAERQRRPLAERVKPEMHQSVIEIGTGVCANIKEAAIEIRSIRRTIIDLARQNGLRSRLVGSHPFAQWHKQEIYPDDRYKIIVEDIRKWLPARTNLIFAATSTFTSALRITAETAPPFRS